MATDGNVCQVRAYPIDDRSDPQWFATTHWSVVLSAADAGSPQCQSALNALCQSFWYPLYAFVRRQGRNPVEAEDLTQDFFARLLAKNGLATVSPGMAASVASFSLR